MRIDTIRSENTGQVVEGAIVLLACCLYALAFPTLYGAVGPGAAAIAVMPVMLISWFWGFRIGVVSSLLAGMLLNPILLHRFGDGTDVGTTLIYAFPYFLAIFALGAVAGYLRDVQAELLSVQNEVGRRRLEAERLAREKAEELLKLKSAFLGSMSHEIRTPLTAVLGFAEILASETDAEHREFAERIVASGKRLQATLSSILDLAQLEGGNFELNNQEIDVAAEVRRVAGPFAHRAEACGIAYEVFTPEHAVTCLLDRASLHRILGCLIDNALKFTDQGSVSIEVRSDDARAFISVRDTGVGISESFLPHLFSDFRQESTGYARSYEGSGLGLAVSKRLVELMGGSVTVESARGKGSSFTVSFPLAAQQNLHMDLEKTGSSSSNAETHVLILDDNTDTLALTRFQLRGKFAVETVSEAQHALESARKRRYDAFLLDINLGGGYDGVDVLRALRELDVYKCVPIVALTAYAMPGDRERFLEAGFDAYLSKPFTKHEITDVIEHALSTQATS